MEKKKLNEFEKERRKKFYYFKKIEKLMLFKKFSTNVFLSGKTCYFETSTHDLQLWVRTLGLYLLENN